jgi:hypothetical protein
MVAPFEGQNPCRQGRYAAAADFSSPQQKKFQMEKWACGGGIKSGSSPALEKLPHPYHNMPTASRNPRQFKGFAW